MVNKKEFNLQLSNIGQIKKADIVFGDLTVLVHSRNVNPVKIISGAV